MAKRKSKEDAWEMPTSFNYDQMLKAYRARNPGSSSEPTYASVAAYSLEQVDAFLDKLGKPVGIKSYKPYQSWGEDFLHNYFGNIGIPIDLYPTFPIDANLVLLTECAAFDPDIVTKIKGQLVAGKSVVITSGLLRALQGHGIEDIVEVRYTERKILADEYLSGFGAGAGSSLTEEENPKILFPDIRFLTNDAWPVIRALSNGRGYPLMLLDRYSHGILYIWTIPENFNDLYRLPSSVTSSIKNYVMAGFPVRLDGPSHVALFAYDNCTFIVQSYRRDETDVTVSVPTGFKQLRNLVTNEVMTAQPQSPGTGRGGGRGRRGRAEQRTSFNVHLLPHSYCVFMAEN